MKQLKFLAFLIGLALCSTLFSCGGDDDTPTKDDDTSVKKVTAISLSQTSLALKVGDSETLKVNYSPSDLAAPTYTWSSSDASVATVSNGTIKAIAKGTAIITVTVPELNLSATCTVTVNANLPTSIALDKTSLTLMAGESATLQVSHAPSNLPAPTYTWASSNTSVATVDNGVVKALSEGAATITVSAPDLNLSATCTLTVTPIVPTSIAISTQSLSLRIGDESQLSATVLPDNAKDKSFTWSSSNEKVVTIDANGKVRAIGIGSAVITAKTHVGNLTSTCNVEVSKIAVESVTLNNKSLDLVIGQTAKLTETISPSNATYKTVKWTSSNESVATVSSEGVVTAKKKGTATISVITNDENKSAVCAVTVKNNNNVGFKPYGNDKQW